MINTNKRKQEKQLNKRFKSIDYSKIPYTDAVPNQKTLKAINGKIYWAKDLEKD